MEQDYYLPPQEKAEEESSEIKENTQKSTDPHLVILAVQGAICAAVLLFCLIVKLFFGGFFSQMKEWYQNNMAVSTDVRQVLEGTGGPLEQGEPDVQKGFILPMKGKLTSSYGYRTDPFTGEIASHNGLDIAAKKGTEIVTAMDGQVIETANHHASYGNYVVVEHGGFETLYAHCEKLSVSKGDWVNAGERIATCGSTGRSTGPHLHFEIRVGGRRIDPTPFLRAVEE